jgi:uncharacterized protein YbaR (Trm112 family)
VNSRPRTNAARGRCFVRDFGAPDVSVVASSTSAISRAVRLAWPIRDGAPIMLLGKSRLEKHRTAPASR